MKLGVTLLKADSIENNSCEFFERFEIAGRAPMVESSFSKVTGEISTFRKHYPVDWFLPKSSSFRNFEKLPFNGICRLAAYRLQQYLKLTFNQIFYKSFENFGKYPGRGL